MGGVRLAVRSQTLWGLTLLMSDSFRANKVKLHNRQSFTNLNQSAELRYRHKPGLLEVIFEKGKWAAAASRGWAEKQQWEFGRLQRLNGVLASDENIYLCEIKLWGSEKKVPAFMRAAYFMCCVRIYHLPGSCLAYASSIVNVYGDE